MSVQQNQSGWGDSIIPIHRRDAYGLAAGQGTGTLIEVFAQGTDLENVLESYFDDPRREVVEVVWGRFVVFVQPPKGGESHITHYEVTTEDTKGETLMAQVRDAPSRDLSVNDRSGTTYTMTGGGSIPTYFEDDDVLLTATPHNDGMMEDTASGTGAGGTKHMLHEHINYREDGEGQGPILYPDNSFNSVFEVIEEEVTGGTLYETFSFGVEIHDEDAVF